MPSIGFYSAILIIGLIVLVFLFVYTNRTLQRGGWGDDMDIYAERFASLSQLSSTEKNNWRDRMPDLVSFMLFQGFITTDKVGKTIQGVFEPTSGKQALQDLFSYLLDGDGARYYTEKLWVDFVEWESGFPYDKKPMTYLELKQFVRAHRMFSGDEWTQTMAKTTTETLATLTQFYNVVVQMERMLAQVIPSNPLVVEAVGKRSRYMLCALSKSTTFETFQLALVGLGVPSQYTLYTQNELLYRRLKKLYELYREPTLSERFENWMFLMYQWEHVLSTSGTSQLQNMTTTLNRLPSQCMNLAVSSVSPTPPASPAPSASATPPQTPSSLTTNGGLYTPIPYPPYRQIVIPTILVPTVQVGAPKDAVAFTPMDTKEDRKIFFILTLVFIGIIFILWDIMFYMWFSGSGSGFGSGSAPAPAPAPADTKIEEPWNANTSMLEKENRP